MQMALYEPGLGYYSAGGMKFGPDGDFVTAPELSPLFSRCLARACAEIISQHDDAEIIEVGGGSGIMATGISRRPSLGSASTLAGGPAGTSAAASTNEGRKLVVGREICLSGEIKACERLIVEGRVEADLTDSRVEIMKG